MIAVFGSGFGLYGYLPALAGLSGKRVLLPARYRDRFERRSELAFFAANVVWTDSDAEVLARAEEVVIALNPAHQPRRILECLERPNIRRLIIEKPLAPTEPEASALLETLAHSGRRFRIGYTLRFTSWADRLRSRFGATSPGALDIDWRFMAHHFRNDNATWKRDAASGGGPLRFFGIHLLALLAELGFDRVRSSTIDDASWTALLECEGRSAMLSLDSRSTIDRFAVSAGGVVIDGKEPFEESTSPEGFPGNDRRVPILYRLYGSFDRDDAHELAVYRRTQELWRQAEALLP